MLIASKRYRPDTVSIAGWSTPTEQEQEKLNLWWKRSDDKINYNCTSGAEQLRIQQTLRSKRFKLSAEKRSGHFLLCAWECD